MKKAVLLMVMCLMVTFILVSPLQAQKVIFTISIEPTLVQNNVEQSIHIEWEITRPNTPSADQVELTISYENTIVKEPETIRVDPNRRTITGANTYSVPKCSREGTYEVKIYHPPTSDHPEHKAIGIARFFVEEHCGKLSIFKFNDLNNNSRRDPGEEGLEGWEFEIMQDGKLADRCVTDPNGYCESSLPDGAYTITEHPKPFWVNTTPSSIVREVKAEETTNVEFGNYPGGTLSIFKFDDLNKNSIREPGEEGLKGWEFEIRQDGRLVDTCVTDPNGYCKSSLLEGTYTITERLKSDWEATTPNPVVLDVNAGQNTNVVFGNHYLPPPGNLSIFKFNDLNNNSRREPGEEGLEGWKFEIMQDGRLVDTCVTDPNGYCESRLPEGTYTITEHLKPDWEATTPNPVVLEVKAEETTNVEFGNHYRPPYGNLSIFKFNDPNNNSRRDPGEEGLEGWEFEIRQDGRLVDTYVTYPNGYCNRSLPEGTYTITEHLKPDWVVTTPNPVVLDVKAGQKTNVEFGNRNLYGNLSIFKFNDRNNNSIRDPDEEGIANWSFEIRQEWQLVDTCVTDPNGYCVRKLLEGRYKITEQQSRCWVSTTPESLEIEVRGGQTKEVKFGNYAIGNLTIQEFYDDNRNKVQEYGEEGLPNWIFTITFPDGSSKRITTDARGTYTLLNVPIGRYTLIEEAMTCRWTNSTSTTQDVEVTACQETIASFGNYIADCSIPPGCPWFNEDENLNVSKSVEPCVCNITPLREGESTSKEEEPEVSVYLRVCVDKRHIKEGIAVENITVVETLHNHFTVVGDSFSEQPSNTWINPDGTTTITWDIPSLCCEEWNVSFNVTATVALPIDVIDTSERVTSKVIYEDPIGTGRRELSIPEGKLKFRFIVPKEPIPLICYVLGGLLLLSISIEITLEWKRRKKEKSKEKE